MLLLEISPSLKKFVFISDLADLNFVITKFTKPIHEDGVTTAFQPKWQFWVAVFCKILDISVLLQS